MIHTDVACTVCGCVCDDLEVRVESGNVVPIRGVCRLAEPWFASLGRQSTTAAAIDGRPAAMEAALNHAADILRTSRNPLIYGLSRSSTPGQRAAVALAEHLRANIDTTASVCHGPSIMAIQQVGEATCTLGEVRTRADLVIFWGANPAESHPRHLERYSGDPRSEFLPRGRADRTVIVIDTKPTASSALADEFVQIEPECDFDLICALRCLLRGAEPPTHIPIGVPLPVLRDLARRMTECRYGVVFFGLGLAQRGRGHLTVAALLQLVAELNAHTRFSARRLRIPGDVAGADSVLCWQTGFPFAVNFSRGYPRYNPGEFSADSLLATREVDACVIVGSESTELLSDAARRVLQELPTIVLDYPHIATPWTPAVRFTTAVYGIHAAGTAYRMDETPIPLRSLLPSDLATDAEVLHELLVRS
ncbi:MAG: formylmethanofuran dehydrogenase subunit B [Planctomycetaceae bacterium]|nr:formylmethanofuran dehydrogenase subunit B [Planctomycetaceae bacterium]